MRPLKKEREANITQRWEITSSQGSLYRGIELDEM